MSVHPIGERTEAGWTRPAKQALKVLFGANVAAAWRFVRSGPRGFAYASSRGFTASYRATCPVLAAIPEIDVDAILGDRRAEVMIEVGADEDGGLGAREAVVLSSLMVAENPSLVLEIGTFMGRTTRLLARNLPSAAVHTVDLPPDFKVHSDSAGTKDDFHLIRRRDVGCAFRGDPSSVRIVQHLHDTETWDFSGIGRPSAFFIDGSHTYGAAGNDSEKCLAIAASGAVFFWHDCDDYHPGVVRCLAEWRDRGRDVRRIRHTTLAYWKSPV